MPNNHNDELIKRKADHLRLCASDRVKYTAKTNGFENYEFIHDAATETDISAIDLRTFFFGHEINVPFMISCMTGGTDEANNINLKLAAAARELKIPLGLGSQRYLLESNDLVHHFEMIRQEAGDIPLVGNIGAAQVSMTENPDEFSILVEASKIDVLAVHLNPAQELFQKGGDLNFTGLMKNLEYLANHIEIPVIVKEVGSGISGTTAARLLETGVKGIDVAGAGGTTWTGVEILRNGGNSSHNFWNWGLPTSYCIRTVHELKMKYDFLLIGSGGIDNSFDNARALALGADITASARKVLQALLEGGTDAVINLINGYFEDLKKIMFLTGSSTLSELRNDKLIIKSELF